MPAGILNGEELTADMFDEKRFRDKVEERDGHWFWTGATNNNNIGIACRLGGKGNVSARRASKAIYYGECWAARPLSPGCGEADCIHPDHLEYRTPKEIAMERLYRDCGPKLCPSDVEQIREEYVDGVGKVYEIADKYGISRDHASAILHNNIWRDPEYDAPTGQLGTRKLPLSIQEDLIQRNKAGESCDSLAEEFGVAQSTMWQFVHPERPRIRRKRKK